MLLQVHFLRALLMKVLQLLKDECDLALGLAGCRSLAEVTGDLLE